MSYFSGLIFILIVSLITIIGDVFMKLAGNSGKYIDVRYFLYGMILYLLTGFGWFFVMKKIELSSIGVIYGVSTAMLLALIGVIFFRENLNFIEIIALLMGTASIFLLMRFAT